MERRDRPSRASATGGDGSPTRVPPPAPGFAADPDPDPDRRAVAVAVAEADGAVSVDALATMLAARAHGRPPARLRASQRRRSRLALVRDHLPALVARDVLRWIDGGAVAPGPALGTLVRAVDREPSFPE